MKKITTISVLFLIFTGGLFAQGAQIPAVVLKDIDERPFNTADIENGGKPIIINFWATWCSPCKRELNNIADVYDEWQDETGVKLIAVSIDDARNVSKVEPYVNGEAWDFEILLDINQDFKRAMSVNNIPHTFLVNGEGKIVWQHNSYSEGDEFHLFELVQKLARGEEIKE